MNARRLKIVLSCALAALFLGAAAGTYYAYTFMKTSVEATKKIKVDAEVNEQARSGLMSVQDQLEDPSNLRVAKYLNEIIPSSTYPSQFIADVKKYASDTNVAISSISFQAAGAAGATAPAAGAAGATKAPATTPTTIPGATAVPITLSVAEGVPYDNFIRFLRKLENNLQHVQIVNVNLQPSGNKTLAGSSVALELYVRK